MLLLALLDLDDLVCDKAVGLTVYCLSCFFVRGLAQTENTAIVFVEPVFQILHPVLLLNLEVLLVGPCDRFGSQSFHTFVNVHIEWHLVLLSFLFSSGFDCAA